MAKGWLLHKGKLLDNIVAKFNKMEVDKSTYTAVWDDINKFIFPNSEQFYSQYSGGQKRRRLQFDGTAERALEIFASSVVGLIANPVTKYINFAPRDKDLLDNREVQEFIEEAQDKVLSVFNDPATKFYDNFFCCVQHLGAYGTSSLMSDTDDKHVAVFKALSPRSFNFEVSFNGSKENIYICQEYTLFQLRQLQDQKGWTLPKSLRRRQGKGSHVCGQE